MSLSIRRLLFDAMREAQLPRETEVAIASSTGQWIHVSDTQRVARLFAGWCIARPMFFMSMLKMLDPEPEIALRTSLHIEGFPSLGEIGLKKLLGGNQDLPQISSAEFFSLPADERIGHLDAALDSDDQSKWQPGYSEVVAPYLMARAVNTYSSRTASNERLILDEQSKHNAKHKQLFNARDILPSLMLEVAGGVPIPLWHEQCEQFWCNVPQWAGQPKTVSQLAQWYANASVDPFTLAAARVTADAPLTDGMRLHGGFVTEQAGVAISETPGFFGHPGWMGRSYAWTLRNSGVGVAFRSRLIDTSRSDSDFAHARSQFMSIVWTIAQQYFG